MQQAYVAQVASTTQLLLQDTLHKAPRPLRLRPLEMLMILKICSLQKFRRMLEHFLTTIRTQPQQVQMVWEESFFLRSEIIS